MGFVNSMKKTFRVGEYSQERWTIATQIFGKSIADELLELGISPTALMTNREVTAYKILVWLQEINKIELQTLPRMTEQRKLQLEGYRQKEELASEVLDCGNVVKWGDRLNQYKRGVRNFQDEFSDQTFEDGSISTVEILGGETNEEALARIIFDTSYAFSDSIGDFLASHSNFDRYSSKIISMVANFGTTLYKYATRLACDRLSELYPDQKEYKTEYDNLLYELAKKLQEPREDFVDTIEHLDKVETLELLQDISKETQQPLDKYLRTIHSSIDKILGETPDNSYNLSNEQDLLVAMREQYNGLIRNPWENNVWVVLTRSICGDQLAKELTTVNGMEGHGSILQICTKQESEAGKILIESILGSQPHSESETEKAYEFLCTHDTDFWQKRLILTKAGLSDTYYRADESEADNVTRWRQYEKIYGKTVAQKLRAINKFCPGWLADQVAKCEGLSWPDIQKQKPAFWQAAFKTYSPKLIKVMTQCEGCY